MKRLLTLLLVGAVLGWMGLQVAVGQDTQLRGASAAPGGLDTYVQFNDGGLLGGDSGLAYNKTTNVLSLTGTDDALPFVITGGSTTGSGTTGLLSIAGTWNTSGSPTAVLLNITRTASGTTPKLYDFQINATSYSQLLVDVAGTGPSLKVTGSGSVPGTGYHVQFYAKNSDANGMGELLLENNTASHSAWLAIHGTTHTSWAGSTVVADQVALYAASALANGIRINAQNTRIVLNAANTWNGFQYQLDNTGKHWWYYSYTDASNYEGLSLAFASGTSTLATESAGTGGANLNLALATKGTGILTVVQGANGSATNLRTATATCTTSSTPCTATGLIPAGSLVIGVDARVTTTITGTATSWTLGDGTTADLWATGKALAAGTTVTMADHKSTWNIKYYSAANNVVITATGGTFTGGVVRLTVHYINLTAATS